MSAKRRNTVVLDFSVLPKRPEVALVEKFVINKLQIDLALVTNVQLSNVRNVVFMEMKTKDAAETIASTQNFQHSIKCEGANYRIPVYLDDDAVDVRVHDLPPRFSHEDIITHMQQYGEVMHVKNEKWKHFFAGTFNGVRVVRMKLRQQIPSYITIGNEPTLITYPNQTKTCRYCEQKAHPKQRCSETDQHRTKTTQPVAQNNSTQANSFQPSEPLNASASKHQAVTQTHEEQQSRQFAVSPSSSPEFRGFPDNANKIARFNDNAKRQRSTDSSDGTSSSELTIDASTEDNPKDKVAVNPQFKKRKKYNCAQNCCTRSISAPHS